MKNMKGAQTAPGVALPPCISIASEALVNVLIR